MTATQHMQHNLGQLEIQVYSQTLCIIVVTSMEGSPTATAQTTDSQDRSEGRVMIRHQSITSEESSHTDTDAAPQSDSVPPQYIRVAESSCPDQAFMPPPSLPSLMEPEEGRKSPVAASDRSVSLRSSDGTDVNTNPKHLDWSQEQNPSMTSCQVNEEMDSAVATLKEKRDSSSGTQCDGQDQELLEDRFKIQVSDDSSDGETNKCNDSSLTKDTMLKAETMSLEETVSLDGPPIRNTERPNLETEDNENPTEVSVQCSINTKEEGAGCKPDDPLDIELTGYDWVKRTGVEDEEKAFSCEVLNEASRAISESRIATEILQGENLLQRLQLVQQRQDLDETPKEEENMMTRENAAPENDQQEEGSDKDQNGSTLLTMTVTFEDCIQKRDVDSCNKEHFENMTVIRADEDVSESLSTSNLNIGIVHLTTECVVEDERHEIHETFDEQICVEEKTSSNNDGDERESEASLPTMSPQQTDDSDADYFTETDILKIKDENRTPIPLCHRLSAAETNMEKQFQESCQIAQDLERVEGLFDLTQNPDVLEIPFKMNISLEPLFTRETSDLGKEGPLSEQEKQKDISQELQKELVVVNLGKIPGGNSKGESRQMKDAKLLFEAFQQEKTEGPTRIRKPQASLPHGQVYPSVLERTRSLERFSQKISPMLRTHSFRQVSGFEKETHPETFRPLSPSIRDKTRLCPYPKHEKRLHKSMDAVDVNMPTAAGVNNSKKEPLREMSLLIKENPFFKLRPALSLQPEVEKDIREAKKREDDLRKQRSSLYGEMKLGSKDERGYTADHKTDSMHKTTGRLECVWPPPAKKDTTQTEQQEAKVQRALGPRAALWQRWETGLVNKPSPTTHNNEDNDKNT
ncbi:unnamed protein product [Knipowitschia caucasica]